MTDVHFPSKSHPKNNQHLLTSVFFVQWQLALISRSKDCSSHGYSPARAPIRSKGNVTPGGTCQVSPLCWSEAMKCIEVPDTGALIVSVSVQAALKLCSDLKRDWSEIKKKVTTVTLSLVFMLLPIVPCMVSGAFGKRKKRAKQPLGLILREFTQI